MTLQSFLLAFILWIDPLVKHVATEDPVARIERLKAIATDMAEVCQDPKESPIFEGDDGRVRTCMLMASIAYNESGFKESVDNGATKGDNGKAVCIMQVQAGQNGELNFSKEELKDRKTCLRASLKVLRASKCNSGHDLQGMLRGYVSGTCKPDENKSKDEKIAKTALLDAKSYINYIKRFGNIPKNIK